MQDEQYPEYLKNQSYEDLVLISYSIDQAKQPERYAMAIAEIDRREKNGEGKDLSKETRPNPLIFFPEIIGVAVAAIATPVGLIGMIVSGHGFEGVAALVIWCVALFFALRFIQRRQYGFAILPMLVVLGLFLLIRKELH